MRTCGSRIASQCAIFPGSVEAAMGKPPIRRELSVGLRGRRADDGWYFAAATEGVRLLG